MLRKLSLIKWLLLAGILAAAVILVLNRDKVYDYYRGLIYKPSSEMVKIRDSLGLTTEGEFVFNASQPVLSERDEFNANCREDDAETAILGCYAMENIYVYNIEDEQFYADTHVTIVRSPKKTFCVKFLYYLLSIGYNMINSCMAKGSTNQTELQRDKLIAYEIAIPSIEEQTRIIDYLDEKCTKIDAAIENISKQIDASKRLKRALINEVITGQRAV